jgi:hypothetical protein
VIEKSRDDITFNLQDHLLGGVSIPLKTFCASTFMKPDS